MSKRSYPDIQFVDTDTAKMSNKLVASFEKEAGRKLYPGDPLRLFILWAAGVIVQERVIIDQSAKQNVPRYAEGEYLDSLAENFRNMYRLEAEPAMTTLRFYLSAKLSTDQFIPKGTRVTVDGNITFETDDILIIKAGSLYGDVTATCQIPGETGNDFLPGQINKLVDVYPYYEKAENITASTGGGDAESDDAFYQRMRENMESFSTAGPSGSYIYHAKTVSPQIADVSVISPEPGVADVKILLKNGELPGEEMLQKVYEALSADTVRPLTDKVLVSAPNLVYFDIRPLAKLSNL